MMLSYAFKHFNARQSVTDENQTEIHAKHKITINELLNGFVAFRFKDETRKIFTLATVDIENWLFGKICAAIWTVT